MFLSQSTFAHQSLTERLAQVAEQTQPLESEKVQMSQTVYNWGNCIFRGAHWRKHNKFLKYTRQFKSTQMHSLYHWSGSREIGQTY